MNVELFTAISVVSVVLEVRRNNTSDGINMRMDYRLNVFEQRSWIRVEEVREKCMEQRLAGLPETNNVSLILSHDNSRCHSVAFVNNNLQRRELEILKQCVLLSPKFFNPK